MSDEEYKQVEQNDPPVKKYAHQLFEYGEGTEGFWIFQRFVDQFKEASKIAEAKYLKQEIVWVFDHSSCDAARPDDGCS